VPAAPSSSTASALEPTMRRSDSCTG
jgi:hypothetical protein